MLAKKERLERAMFEYFFRKGKSIHTTHLQLVFSPHTTTHAAVVVPKKVAKHATTRNKLRRRVYAILRERIQNGVYLFILKRGSATLPYQTLKDEVDLALQRIRT